MKETDASAVKPKQNKILTIKMIYMFFSQFHPV